jgi:hypothetical protein
MSRILDGERRAERAVEPSIPFLLRGFLPRSRCRWLALEDEAQRPLIEEQLQEVRIRTVW